MITQSDHPVAWALLLYELDEVREHLEELVNMLARDGSLADADFQVHIGHVYSHINRVWNGRNDGSEERSDERWQRVRQFPTDIEPVG